MKKVYFDAGHGGVDSGAVKYVTEKTVASKVVKYACDYLKKNYSCEVYEDTTDDSTHTISARANKWGADLFVSVHFNAGGGDGFEALVYGRANTKLGECFEKHVKATGQNSRGVKYRPELNVLRLTDMPAILNEIAFVDNKKDIEDWNEADELKVMGKALAYAAADWLNLKKKAAQKPSDKPQKAPAKALKVGDIVKVKKGAKSYEGRKISAWVYNGKFKVDEIKGDRVVLEKKGICTAFKKSDLSRV